MKLTKTFIATAMISGIGVTSLASVASAQTYDGVNTGEIQVNGTIGKVDNTNPDAELPEGSDDWINVTVDTATAFHTTTASAHTQIESAKYTIQNNSGRGVAVYLSSLTGTPNHVTQLTINPEAASTALSTTPTAVNLVDQNAIATMPATAWLLLANNEGRLNLSSDAQNAYGNAAKFYYTGTVSEAPTTATAENYTLTLRFASIQADGTTIGK